MSEIEDGGPAFPSLNAEFTGISSDGQERYEVQPSGGMALRDYFAAKALPAVLEQKDVMGHQREWDNAAWIAYQIADSMLAARQEPRS